VIIAIIGSVAIVIEIAGFVEDTIADEKNALLLKNAFMMEKTIFHMN
jgi:hypothetical protein